MKTLTTRIAALLLLTTFCTLNMNAQTPSNQHLSQIPLGICSYKQVALLLGTAPWGNPGDEGGAKSPAQPQTPPSVSYNDENIELVLSSGSTGVLTLYIIGGDGSLEMERSISYNSEEETSVSVGFLAEGNYVVLLKVGQTYYWGEFEIE